MARSGATFADAAAEYLRDVGEDRNRKASTVEDYRSIIRTHLLPAFGEERLNVLHGVFAHARKVWGFANEPGRGGRAAPRSRQRRH